MALELKLYEFRNSKGQLANVKIKPDLQVCQACPNVANYTAFSLGPMPTPVQCTNEPVCVVVENKPDPATGLIGSMSLCRSCLELFQRKLGNGYGHVTMIREIP